MTIRAGQINGTANLNRDNDLGALGFAQYKDFPGKGAVLSGLAVSTNAVAVGRCVVVANRTSVTPNEDFFMHIAVTATETIDTSGTKKVWVEPIQTHVDDASLNTSADGTGIAQVNTGADWPATPHVRLATVAGGVITDARVYTKTMAEAARDNSFSYGLTTGSANAYLLELVPTPAAYVTGMEVVFKTNFGNTGAATVNVNSLGAKTLKLTDGTTDLPSGFLLSGQVVCAVYDGTNFVITSAPYTGYALASQAQAEAGVENSLAMTSLRTKQAITAKAASTSERGSVELATDSEAMFWGSAVIPDASQILWVYGYDIGAGTDYTAKSLSWQSSTSVINTWQKLKEITCGISATYTVGFTYTAYSSWYALQIWKNGVAYWTSKTWGTGSWEENLAFTAWDLIQVYGTSSNNGATPAVCQSMWVKYNLTQKLIAKIATYFS